MTTRRFSGRAALLFVPLTILLLGESGDSPQPATRLSAERLNVPPTAPPEGLYISGITVVAKTRISRTVFEYTYTADITNNGRTAVDVAAVLTIDSPHTTVMDGQVSFGDVSAGVTTTSTDTFVFRHDRRYPFNPASMMWAIQATIVPPDPQDDAPPLDPTVATDMATATEFLYTGEDPIQTDVDPGTIETRRVAVLRGKVLTREGDPLLGVLMTILGHPELGQTLSRDDGMYDMAVNGGGLLTAKYEREGYLPAQRQLQVPWRDYAWLPDVVLIPADDQVTAIDLTAPIPMQVARGSVVTDDAGTRQATMLIPQGTQAEMVLPDGSTQPLASLNLRMTEYTVGETGPNAMPAELPPAVGYTYCVKISDDASQAAGATELHFDPPVYTYIEDFIGFPVGSAVPVGYYDETSGHWVGQENGRVLKILNITGGLADLDTDGDDVADDPATLAELNITDAEREQLASLYAAGQCLWRVPVTHCSPSDCNWPFGPPDDAEWPEMEPEGDDLEDDVCVSEGSIIDCQNQILGHRVDVVGTPFSLNYRSNRVFGRQAAYHLRIPLSGDSLPDSLEEIRLSTRVAGRWQFLEFPPDPNQVYDYIWDGRDAYGRFLQGPQNILVDLHYVYIAAYYPVSRDRENAWNRVWGLSVGLGVVIPSELDSTITLTANWQGLIGTYRAITLGLGGWTLDVHHVYGPDAKMLYLGDGGTQSAQNFNATIRTAAGNGSFGFSGDGGPATEARLRHPYGVACHPDGGFFIADTNNRRIRRVGPDGIITTFAGTGDYGTGGDGGPATAAQFISPVDVAVGLDGSVYIVDRGAHCVRRVAPDGIISTMAGTPDTGGYAGDGGPATEALLLSPYGTDVSPDGSVYIADTSNNRVRRVGLDGIITTIAGGGTSPDDEIKATEARLIPRDVAVGPDGSLYIPDTEHGRRIRRVATDGIITTVAGCVTGGSYDEGIPATEAWFDWPNSVAVAPDGSLYLAAGHYVRWVKPDGTIRTYAGEFHEPPVYGGYGGDDGPATAARLDNPMGLAVNADGDLFIADWHNHRIRVVAQPFPGAEVATSLIPSRDGSQLYHFDASGRHISTLHTLTGAVLYSFTYDDSGLLVSIEDGDGNITAIERDGDGAPVAIVSPYGQRTTFTLDSNGYFESITSPANEVSQFTYTDDGLMTDMVDAGSNPWHYDYDGLGRLTRVEDPAGGFKELVRTDLEDGREVTLTTAEGVVNTYRVETLSTDEKRYTNILGCCGQNEVLIGTDGTSTTTYADGSVITKVPAPDPRWGMLAPMTRTATITLPSSLTYTADTSRTVVLADPYDPFSIQSVATTLTLDGRDYLSEYDSATRTYTLTTPEGRQTTVGLDDLGAVVRHQLADLGPLNVAYDTHGRLQTITQGSPPDIRVSSFTYTSLGLPDTITEAENHTIDYDYDAQGILQSATLPGGRVVGFEFDALQNMTGLTPPGRPTHTANYTPIGRLETYTPPDVNAGDDSTSYTYNLDRQQDLITLPDGRTIDYDYDSAGRLSTITLNRGVQTYTYDTTTSQLISIVSPDGIGLAYNYDGRLQDLETWTGQVTGTVSHDYSTRLQVSATSINGAYEVSFESDDDGETIRAGDLIITRDPQDAYVTAMALGNVTTSYGYNEHGELVNQTAAYSGSPIYAATYVRDDVGRITTRTETIEGVTTVYDYDYDAAGRLEGMEIDSVPTTGYTYDGNGNRLSSMGPGGTATGTYDDQDRLISWGPATYDYTANGDLLSKTVGSSVTTYEYDALGNLVHVGLPDGTDIDYLIDGRGRRVGKKVDGVLVQGFLYSDRLTLAELDGNNNVVSRFVVAFGSVVSTPAYMIRDGQVYRLIIDHRGSPRLVVNVATGAVAQRMDFDEYGYITLDSNPGFQPFGFAGGLYDPDTGLVCFGARDYDAAIGRWTAKDPIRFAAGDPNLYAYVMNDPLNAVDPSGLGDCDMRITQIKGDVDVEPTACGETKSQIIGPIGPGFPIEPGDVIRTGKKGRVEIRLEDNSFIRLGGRQKLEITDSMCKAVPGPIRHPLLGPHAQSYIYALISRLLARDNPPPPIQQGCGGSGIRG